MLHPDPVQGEEEDDDDDMNEDAEAGVEVTDAAAERNGLQGASVFMNEDGTINLSDEASVRAGRSSRVC